MQTTKPADPNETLQTPDLGPHKLSPLALAALANGVAFEDVVAYVKGLRGKS